MGSPFIILFIYLTFLGVRDLYLFKSSFAHSLFEGILKYGSISDNKLSASLLKSTSFALCSNSNFYTNHIN